MFKIIYPSADSTLYEAKPTYNTGIDEILEVGKHLTVAVTSSYSLSRSLIKFIGVLLEVVKKNLLYLNFFDISFT